jgi:hypothetical protein
MALHPPSEESSWGRVKAQGADDTAHEMESGEEAESGAGSAREATGARGAAASNAAGAEGRGKGADDELLTSLEGIAEFKVSEALRIKALRQEGAISEDEYKALKQQVKDRCKAAKAALAAAAGA